MRNRYSLLSFVLPCFLICLLTTSTATAESAKGRLPDGRAWRKDAGGFQVVDYIAELEVGMEEMKRKVYGLEGELEEKDSTIRRLRASGGREAQIKETDLYNSNTKRYEVVESKPVKKAEIVPAINEIKDCSAERAAERIAVRIETESRVQKELESEKRRIEDLRQELALRDNREAEINSGLKRRQESARLRESARLAEEAQRRDLERIADAETKNQNKTIEDLKKKQVALNSELLKLQGIVDSKEEKLELSSRKVLRQESQLKELNEHLKARDLELKNSRTQLTTLSRQSSEKKIVTTRSSKPVYRQPVSALTTRSVVSLESSAGKKHAVLNGELKKLKGLIGLRNREYAEIKKGSRVSFKPRSIRSSRRYSVGMVESELRRADNMRDLKRLEKDIAEMKALAKKDIALIRRMSKL